MTPFTFSLDSIQITNTRSLHVDSDYVAFALYANETLHTKSTKIGNVNNGVHLVSLSFDNLPVRPEDNQVILAYLIANTQSVDAADTGKFLESVCGQMTVAGLIAPQLNSALQSLATWITDRISPTLTPGHCDGAVAAERNLFTGAQAIAQASPAGFLHHTTHHGTNSATGCGSNSTYIVTWHMGETVSVPDVEGLSVGVALSKIRAARLTVASLGKGSIVASQSPAGGALVSAGSTVSLVEGAVGR